VRRFISGCPFLAQLAAQAAAARAIHGSVRDSISVDGGACGRGAAIAVMPMINPAMIAAVIPMIRDVVAIEPTTNHWEQRADPGLPPES
jgi:hypothetical protein